MRGARAGMVHSVSLCREKAGEATNVYRKHQRHPLQRRHLNVCGQIPWRSP